MRSDAITTPPSPHPRSWVLVRAEYERLASLDRQANLAGNFYSRRVRRIRGLLRIAEEQLAVELERACE